MHNVCIMKTNNSKIYPLIVFLLLLAPLFTENMWAKDFIVVIDPGHGGHDPGAVGRISKEKDINLKVALKVGQLIKENCKDVKVIYTRNKDVFIPLDKRAEIANNAKANLFVSIHTNAVGGSRKVLGASTWTLGLAKSEENLKVAQRENAVMLYEDDYKTKYEGFNPNSAESYIIFEFMQDKYMSQSVKLASLMQKQFKNTCKRVDHGVHQAGFWVLRACAMPSILIELGFISTPEEERYLNTSAGVNSLSKGIFNAILQYKNDTHTTVASTVPVKPAAEPETITIKEKEQVVDVVPEVIQAADNDIIFKIQLFATSRLLPTNDPGFKGLKGIQHYQENGVYKYTYQASTNYNNILRTKREITAKFKDAFIVAFRNGKRIDINEAIREYNRKKQTK